MKLPKQDSEILLLKSVQAEAQARVFELLEEALAQLSPDSRTLIKSYWEGKTLKILSKEFGISLKETKAWLDNTQRELLKNLRMYGNIKQ